MANYWIAQERCTLVPQAAKPDSIGYAVQVVPARSEVFSAGFIGYNENQALSCTYTDAGKILRACTSNANSASSSDIFRGVAVNSTHVYNVGYTNVSGVAYDILITKYDFDGAVVTSSRFSSGAGGSNADYGYSCVADENFVYVGGLVTTGVQKASLSVFSTTGLTHVLDARLTSASGGNCRFTGITKNSASTAIYLAGYDGGYGTGIVAKFDNAGTLQWQKSISETTNVYLYAIAINSSGSAIYVVGSGQDSTRNGAIIIKFDSSGNVVWSKKLYNTTSSQSIRFSGVAVDASENIYACGAAQNSSGADEGYLVKYNSSGVLQWQRRIYDVSYSTSSNSAMQAASVDNLGGVYINGYLSTPQGTMITMKVADDGTGTGLYGNVYYLSATYGTEQTGTVSITNGTLTASSGGLIQSSSDVASQLNYTYLEQV